jgi:cytochrome c oxidase subunit 2
LATPFWPGAAVYIVIDRAAAAQAVESAQIIKISASRFQFSPNLIILRRGQLVTLQLTSTHRTYGFMLRALDVDTDITPGQTKNITVTLLHPGTFRAICDHYCGIGYGNMKMTIVVKDSAPEAAGRTNAHASYSGGR